MAASQDPQGMTLTPATLTYRDGMTTHQSSANNKQHVPSGKQGAARVCRWQGNTERLSWYQPTSKTPMPALRQ